MNSKCYRRLNLAAFISLLLLLVLYIKTIFNTSTSTEYFDSSEDKPPTNSIACYRIKSESLPDISKMPPIKDKSIFFHETSCNSFSKGKIFINARQACAVESAAILHPDLDVYLLYSSPGVFKFNGEDSDYFLRALLSYENVNIMHTDFEKYSTGTPAEKLYDSGTLESSNFVVFHTSDVLRYITLWKYGGIYLDLDVIVKKRLTDLALNFAGFETNDSINTAILSFSSNGSGHEIVEKCLNYQQEKFNPLQWTDNGPVVLSNVLQSTCGVNLKKLGENGCQGFSLYPEKTFYPIALDDWEDLFDENLLKDVMSRTKDSYVVHAWSDVSFSKKILTNSTKTPYLHLAEKYCPKIARALNKYF